ncbi:MAG: hypothetical protein KGJ57_22890 [Sphingomonadales bacterium]|nr:hypothetical protein [Sphingomonadales bacterium]MDE2172233.1 hypothetical protein [Sphingomonadales bacterium]
MPDNGCQHAGAAQLERLVAWPANNSLPARIEKNFPTPYDHVVTNDPNDQIATEEAGSTPVPSQEEAVPEKREMRGFLGAAKRDLTDEELASPAVRRFLIAEIERLESECSYLKEIQNKYNNLRVSNAALTEQSKFSVRIEVLTFLASSVGAAGMGAAPSFITVDQLSKYGWIMLALSLILVVAGVISRFKK